MIKILISFSILLVSEVTFAQTATPSAAQDNKPLSAKKLEFEDQSISALDPDYGKLDLTSLNDKNSAGGRLYPVRKSFHKEQQEAVKNWGIGE